MKNYYFLLLLLIVLFSVNSFAYNIEKIDTSITVIENGILQVNDIVLFTEIKKGDSIVLPIIPVYDLKIKNTNKDINYNYSFNTLTINLNNCCILDNSLTLEIIYLTDVYSFKNGNVWSVSYLPIFKEYVDSFSLILPKKTEIISLSLDYRNVTIQDNKFLVTYNEPISYFDINYSIHFSSMIDKKPFNWFLFFMIFFISFFVFFVLVKFILKKKKSLISSNKEKIEAEDLLLGLNENEQKIIKIVLEKNGILQKNLSKECFLPKGTVSRNLKKLEGKGYIDVKRYGVNKKVFLGKVFSKK